MAAAAPALMPMMPGSASGLRVTPCRIAPLSPSAAPTVRPSSVRGTRISRDRRSATRTPASKSVNALPDRRERDRRASPCVMLRKQTTTQHGRADQPERAPRARSAARRRDRQPAGRARRRARGGQSPMLGIGRARWPSVSSVELLGVVGVGVQPVRRPGRVRLRGEGLDALRDRLLPRASRGCPGSCGRRTAAGRAGTCRRSRSSASASTGSRDRASSGSITSRPQRLEVEQLRARTSGRRRRTCRRTG